MLSLTGNAVAFWSEQATCFVEIKEFFFSFSSIIMVNKIKHYESILEISENIYNNFRNYRKQ